MTVIPLSILQPNFATKWIMTAMKFLMIPMLDAPNDRWMGDGDGCWRWWCFSYLFAIDGYVDNDEDCADGASSRNPGASILQQ